MVAGWRAGAPAACFVLTLMLLAGILTPVGSVGGRIGGPVKGVNSSGSEGSSPTANGLPYPAYTLNLLNGSRLPQNAPAPPCSLPTAAPYIVHAPHGPNGSLALPALNELWVVCPSGHLLVLNATTGSLLAQAVVGAGSGAMVAQDIGGADLVYVANAGSSNVSVLSSATDRVVGTIPLPAGAVPVGLALGPGGDDLFVTDTAADSVLVVSTLNGSLVGSIGVGQRPSGIAFDPIDGRLYVANNGSATVSVIDPVRRTALAQVPVGLGPVGVTVASLTGNIYVSNFGSGTVSVVPPFGSRTVENLSIGGGPRAIAYSAADNAVYVAGFQSGLVSVLNASTNLLVGTVAVGTAPSSVTVGNGVVYSTNAQSLNVSRIFGLHPQIVGTLTVATAPRGLAYDPATSELFVPLGGNDSVAVINVTRDQLVGLIPTGIEPSLALYDPFDDLIYVDNHHSSTLSVIDPARNAVVATIPVGEGPTSLALDPVSHDLYVGCGHIDVVQVIDPAHRSILASIPVGQTPYGLVYAPVDGGEIFVTNYRSNTLSVIDPGTNTVVGTYRVGSGPTLMGVAPDGSELYIASFKNGTLIPFNLTSDTVGAPIPVGADPMGVLVDGPGGLLYVVNYGSSNLTAIAPGTGRPVGSIPVGSQPIAAALLPNGATYVTDAGGSSVSILSNASFRSVSVAPPSPTVAPGGGVALAALPACAPGACPSSIQYHWTLVRGAGSLNSTQGAAITFVAPQRSGPVALSVRATLGPYVRLANFTITVAPPAPEPSILGLPPLGAYALLVGLAIGVAGVLFGVVQARRSGRRSAPPPPEPTGTLHVVGAARPSGSGRAAPRSGFSRRGREFAGRFGVGVGRSGSPRQ